MENRVRSESAKVQHVARASSDELLRKFAEVGSASEDERELRLVKRLRRSETASGRRRHRGGGREAANCSGGSAVVERMSLIISPAAPVRHFGIGKVRVRSMDLRTRSFVGTLKKTWRKTIEGASNVFIEKQYNGHKRLINDIY
ncbi:unnamed protein product [Cuscuta campestris]|uniref:Uncharacterized protein n=2 Tax=Cuscuta sect. Cleistogrammica TaxID=1824901 RepID=A0A484K0G9_9ASTE|nr:hypothetical protein DM860_010502 [Cuscuta australis]VFQ59281.1 unnamed protein product [Cuscuta campestris]